MRHETYQQFVTKEQSEPSGGLIVLITGVAIGAACTIFWAAIAEAVWRLL